MANDEFTQEEKKEWLDRTGASMAWMLTMFPPLPGRTVPAERCLVVTIQDYQTGETVAQRTTWRPPADFQRNAIDGAQQVTKLDAELIEWCLTPARLAATGKIESLLLTPKGHTVKRTTVKALVRRQALGGRPLDYTDYFKRWEKSGFDNKARRNLRAEYISQCPLTDENAGERFDRTMRRYKKTTKTDKKGSKPF